MSSELEQAQDSRAVTYRVAMDDRGFQAVLEAARYADSSFVRDHLLDIALSYKNSADSGWVWRMEDEGRIDPDAFKDGPAPVWFPDVQALVEVAEAARDYMAVTREDVKSFAEWRVDHKLAKARLEEALTVLKNLQTG